MNILSTPNNDQVMECTDLEMGFNAANETMVNMITAGIIDPTKVMLLKKFFMGLGPEINKIKTNL